MAAFTRASRWLAIAGLAILSLASVSSADLLVRGYQAGSDGFDPRYDRFADSSEFIAAGLDFAGVGQDGTTWQHWATMISPHFFLSAGHYSPNGTITFYDTNSLTGGSQQYTVVGGQQLHVTGETYATDIFIGMIDGPGMSTYYPILDSSLVTTGISLLVYGKPNRVGTNVVSSIEPISLIDGTGKVISQTTSLQYSYGATGNPGDAQLMPGDSGGPSFVRFGTGLALVGTHSGADTSSYPYLSADSAPSFYVDEIDAVMRSLASLYGVGVGEQITVVPEPSVFLLLGVSILVLAVCALRKRAAYAMSPVFCYRWRRGRR